MLAPLSFLPATAEREQGLCFLHEHKIAHCAYGEPSGVMMDIGRSSCAGFDRTRLPVRYYRVNFSRAMQLPREADPRSASFCRDVRDCGDMLQSLVDEVSTHMAAADSEFTWELRHI
jgi:hypothetical protein